MKMDKIMGVYRYHWRRDGWVGFSVGVSGLGCRAAFYLKGILYRQGQMRHYLRINRAH